MNLSEIKLLNKLNKKYYFVFAFILSSLGMYLTLSVVGLLSTGRFCIMYGDLFEIYVPCIRNMFRDLLNGETIYYSWNNSLGLNTSLSLAHNCFSPFNILYLIFYFLDPKYVTAAVIILKAGTIGLCFQLFCRYSLKIEGLSSVLFSLFYSLCSFQVSCNTNVFIWMDALYTFPLIIMGMDYLKRKGKIFPLCLAYSYLFIVNFYMGYIAGLCSFVLFILKVFLQENNISKVKIFSKYLISVLISFAVSSVVLYPAAIFLLKNHASDSTSFSKILVNILDIYNQLFLGNNSPFSGKLPNIYCGILPLLLLPVFFISKEIDKKTKILYGASLVLLFASCVILPFYALLHAFDAPDCWPYRFAWIISFLLCCMGIRAFEVIKEIKNRTLIIVSLANILLYLIELFVYQVVRESYTVNSLLFLGINVCIFVLWLLLLSLYKKQNSTELCNSALLIFIIIASFEMIGNGYARYYKTSNGDLGMRDYMYDTWYENQGEILSFIKNDQDFFRVNYNPDIIANSDTFSGYNGISDFNTIENYKLRRTMKRLGFATSPRVSRNFGLNDASSMILGVKYDVVGKVPSFMGIKPPEMDTVINEIPYFISLGYLVNDDIKNVELDEYNAFNNINSVISSMCGEKIEVFKEDNNNIEIIEDGMTIEKSEDGFTFIAPDEEFNYIRFRTVERKENMYFYFENYESQFLYNTMLVLGGYEINSKDGGKLSSSFIKKFDENLKEQYVEVYNNGEISQTIKGYDVAILDYDELNRSYDMLSKNKLNVESYKNGYVKGNIDVSDTDSNLLFTSIPFDEGWSLYINGEKSDNNSIALLDDAFLGIELPGPGNYEIELKYHPQGLNIGIILCSIGLGLLILTFCLENKRAKSDI